METTSTAACPSCGKPSDPSWSTCPFCATALAPPSCPSCGQEVQPGWVACPFCGSATAAAPPAEPAAPPTPASPSVGDGASGAPILTEPVIGTGPTADDARSPMTRSLLVWSRIEATLNRERGKLIERINHGAYADTSDIRDFFDDLAGHVDRDLREYSGRVSIPVGVTEAEIERELAPFGSQLSRALDKLARAVSDAKALNIPETTLDAHVQGALGGLMDAGGYVAAGAMLGSIVPGIGNVVGAAVGGWYGQHKRGKEMETALEAYSAALEAVGRVVDEAEGPVYAAVASGSPALLGGSEVAPVVRGLTKLCERADALDAEGESAEAFEVLTSGDEEADDEYGPFVRRVLHHTGNELSWSREVREAIAENLDELDLPALIEHFYYDPFVLEATADAAAFGLNPGVALQAAAAARKVGADGPGIAISEARAHEAAGDHPAAFEALDRAVAAGADRTAIARLRARSLATQEKYDEAAEVMAETVGVYHSISTLGAVLEEDGLQHLARTSALAPFFGEQALRHMIGSWFSKSDVCKVLPKKQKETKVSNAREAYIKGVTKNPVLLLLDDTMWGSAKNGVAVTEDRIIWCALWQDAQWLELDGGHGAFATVDEDDQVQVHAAGETIDVPCPAGHEPALVRLINATQ